MIYRSFEALLPIALSLWFVVALTPSHARSAGLSIASRLLSEYGLLDQSVLLGSLACGQAHTPSAWRGTKTVVPASLSKSLVAPSRPLWLPLASSSPLGKP